jgi:arabinose-5-phosphate isomerase
MTERSAAERIAEGRRVLEAEATALQAAAAAVGESFATAVGWMLHCRGRVLVTGLGKSGLVARKVAATLTGSGTPALFVHPVEALHGDLGIATREDLLLAISRSGSNPEILRMAASLRAHGVRCIALSCEARSTLAQQSDLLLHTPLESEACPLGLSPTSSTTAAMALGDALAMCLLVERGLGAEDFALLHPSGALGATLSLTVREIMHGGAELPSVAAGTPLRDALVEISGKRLGCTCVVEQGGQLVGFLSDGDLRRVLLGSGVDLQQPVDGVMSRRPRTVGADVLAREALRRMEANEPGPITQLVVVESGRPIGVVHIHDILGAGVQRG